MLWAKIKRFGAAVSEGVGTFVTTSTGVYARTGNLWGSLAAGFTLGIYAAWTYNFFQGDAMAKKAQKEQAEKARLARDRTVSSEDALLVPSSPEKTPRTISYEQPPENTVVVPVTTPTLQTRLIPDSPAQKKNCRPGSKSAQLIYLKLNAAQTVSERDFLLRAVFGVFSYTPALVAHLVWFIIPLLFFKQPFDTTHEIYENLKNIVNYFNKNKDTKDAEEKPICAPLLNKLSGDCPSKFVRVTGSGEHTLAEISSILPVLPKNWTDALIKEPLRNGLMVSLPLAYLTVLTFYLTYYFEGGHSVKNLKENAGLPYNKKPPNHYSCWASFLHSQLYLMGPLHGLKNAMPVFLTLQSLLIDSPNLMWPLVYLPSLIIFVFSTLGAQDSEVSEAQQELSENKPARCCN